MDTNTKYSPWDLLPAPEPKTVSYPADYFYENVAKHLIKDTVRIMNNGLSIDLEEVVKLESVLDEQLSTIADNLAVNPLVKEYQKERYKKLVKNYKKDRKTKLRTKEYYLKPFKPGDMNHRSYFMYLYAKERGIQQPEELLPTGVPKWTANTVKKLAKNNPVLQKLLDKKITESHPIAKKAMDLLATHKKDIYNEKYIKQIENPEVDLPPFNPGSPDQKRELFTFLGISSNKVSKKTGKPSFDRDIIEEINKTYVDKDIINLTQQLIDFSYAAIVRNNFIEAFYRYTIDGRLYGQYKLLGAKSGRYTSSNPNMLNAPSTKSIFAKPVKNCFKAPEGFVVASIDYSALEDRVIANLSRDTNKLGIFLNGIDGHSLAATYYYPNKVKEIIGNFKDNKKAAIELKAIVDDKTHKYHKEATEVRQDSKPISFGLAYGAFPPKVAATVKIPIEDATIIFNAYHNDMYPGVTEYREDYVLPTTIEEGEIHLGLGFMLKSDNPTKDIRTLNNATVQFWSILTALVINKIHQLIDEAGLQDDIVVTSTIYDSIYFEVRDNAEVIKWLNDNIVPIMTIDFMENQTVPNDADLEIGPSWAELYTLSHTADIEEINSILENWRK